MRWAQRLRPLRGPIGMASLAAALLSAPHAGFMAFVVVLGLLIRLPLAIHGSIRWPEMRGRHAAVLGVWGGAALLLDTAAQGWRHVVVRADANAIVAEIGRLHAVHHRYPADPSDNSLSHGGLAARLDLAGYVQDGQLLHFFHRVTWMPFAVWSFGVRSRPWEPQD